MKYSPLFWPIRLKCRTIYILDETRLPRHLAYIKVSDYRGAAAAIRQMKTRAVGQVLLVMYTFLLELKKLKKKQEILPVFRKVAAALNVSRPTLSFKTLTGMVLSWAQKGYPLEKRIEEFLKMLEEKRLAQAKAAADLLRDGDTVLTHCNVSGLMPLIGDFARRRRKRVNFFVTETRPYLQGARLSAWELERAGFGVTIIADNMVAQVMHEGKISKVIVGADHLAQNGDIANKIGTFQIALLARHFKIPFLVLCPPPSTAATGKEIRIEIRPQKELLQFQGIPLAPRGAQGYYPAFDITPVQLITRHIHLSL